MTFAPSPLTGVGAAVVRALAPRVPARALTAPLAAAMAPAAAQFARALHDPLRAQRAAFRRIRRQVRALDNTRTLEALRDIPISTYDDYAPIIDAVANGRNERERAILTRAPVTLFERSGGSTAAQKLLPMTQPFLDEMNRALLPWLFSLYALAPGVGDGCSYWSISPLGDKPTKTPGGIPIGARDVDYFAPQLRPLIGRILAITDDDVAGAANVDACRIATLRALIQRRDLTFISAWSPTFLTLLFDELPRLTSMAPSRLWPNLALISMWTDASSAQFADDIRARFPNAAVQPKGLLAVEGAVSIPWPSSTTGAPVLATRAHVLEFLDDAGDAHFAHEIEDGKTYEVLLTTSAGLTRYRLGDRVVVDGRALATPCVRFVGRTQVSDLVGEKLSSAFVGAVLRRCAPRARFAMLAPRTPHAPQTPTRSKPHYRLYLDAADADTRAANADADADANADVVAVAAAVERELAAGHPYRYARDLGQLGAVDAVVVREALRKYETACVARGQRAGDVKATPLSLRDDWDAAFGVVARGASRH